MSQIWKGVILIGVVLILVLGFAAPTLLPVLRIVLALTYVIASMYVIRQMRIPARHIRLSVYGVVAAVVGAMIRLIHGIVTDETYPFPSPADVFGYAFYGFLVASAVALVRTRTRERRHDDSIDAALAGVVAFSIQYCFVLDSYLTDPGEPLGERLVNGGFAVATTALIVMCARISFGPGVRNGSYYLLAAAVASGVANDIGLQMQAAGQSDTTRFTALLAPLGLVFVLASILHPAADRLVDRPSLVEHELSFRRQSFVFAAALYGVGSVVWMSRHGSTFGWILAAVCAAAIVALAIARMKLMVAERQEAVLVEQRLRKFTASTSMALNAQDLEEMARTFVAEIAPDVLLDRFRIGRGPTPAASLDTIDSDPMVQQLLENEHGGWRDRLVRGSGLVVDDAALVALGGARGSITIVTVPSRTCGTVLLYVEARQIVSRRRQATLESLALQLSLLHDSIEAIASLQRQRSDDRFRTLVQDTNDIVALVGADSLTIEFISPTLTRLLGYSEDDALGRSPLARMHEDDRRVVEERLDDRDDLGNLTPIDVRLQHSDGHYVWFSLAMRDLSDEPEVTGLLFSFSDIHDRKMAELQLLSAEARYRALVTNASDVMALINDGTITYVSPNVERVFGYSVQDLIGAKASAFLTEASVEAVDPLFDHGMLTSNGAVRDVEMLTVNGDKRIAELTFSDPALGNGDFMVTIRDVTEQHRLEASLRSQVLHDPLTGMFNRASVYPELQRALQGLESGAQLGVVHLDVNEFRAINESLGFEVGDSLLIEIATRLRGTLRRSDTIARLNGDEFAIVTSGASDDHILALANRLGDEFGRPFVLGDRPVTVGVTMGLALSGDRRENATHLLEGAGLALRQAKADGKSLVVFEQWMREAAAERFELAEGLLGAIEAGEFSVVYQPLFDMSSQKVTSCEALLRWRHPERGYVSPGVFIQLAEQSGAIVELGRWVLDQACRQLVRWHGDLHGGTGLSMSVNVSARQLEVPGEAAVLQRIIDESGIAPSSLILELTESVMLGDAAGLRAQLENFRAQGVRVAVDDFGTGAAGLAHLRDIPFDIVKIDKSYVDGLGQSDEAHTLISGVIELAHGMKAKIVAEGIETPKQVSLLRDMRCDYGQGFYLGRPMEPPKLEEWFAEGRAGAAASSIV